jgi:hypothetical protein
MSEFTRRLYSRCQCKVRFATKAEAQRQIDRMVRSGVAVPGTLRAYVCDGCAGQAVHIGHRRCSTRDLRPTRNLITSGSVLLLGQGSRA